MISSKVSNEQVLMFCKEGTFISNSINIRCAKKKRDKGETKDFRKQTNSHKSTNDCSPGIICVWQVLINLTCELVNPINTQYYLIPPSVATLKFYDAETVLFFSTP